MNDTPFEDPETREDFAALIVLVLSIQQRHGLALRKLRRGWIYTLCPPDERMMRYRNTPAATPAPSSNPAAPGPLP